ncbi:MAG: hypothetical protein Q8R18_03250 [bacterium]|nr:hypothetical protein [bacterium]
MKVLLRILAAGSFTLGTANWSYAADPVLASKNTCTSEAACISDLLSYINEVDGLTEIKDLGGPIETAQQLVYGNVPDGKVTRAEAIDRNIKFCFPSSRPELYEKSSDNGAPSCTAVGSVPLRANFPITEEDVRNERGMSTFGYCTYTSMYDDVMRAMIKENFQLYDINKDDVISKLDDTNNDNMITLEDILFTRADP